ncbi:MFS transporter [Afifella sp. H1R]|uniref:MFS transporter n=1 Tax=Afifella sp. H1R TaxID=2908841 RepID=UPI001F255FB7|nr:MFS transporter [Afifella sp. H1R]MCF1504328.1 MFS transporter [Afifella sp. H1R]
MSNESALPGTPAVTTALSVHTATTVIFLAASSALTPLYRLYQAAWGFSPGMLTLIFGVYAFALLTSLVLAGSLSDYLGRRPVLSLALLLEVAAITLFLIATSPGWLLAARLVQGAATGLATSTLAAALIDLDRRRGALINSISPMLGMGFGALGTTALVEIAPAPLHLVFVVLLVALCLQLVLTWRTPETAQRRPGALASLRPRIFVPQNAWTELLAVTPINVAVWALGGFYLSLMPSLIATVTAAHSTWLGGLTVAALTMSGGLAILLLRQSAPLTALVSGACALILGVSVTLIGADLHLGSLLLAGSVIGGLGFGAAFLGAMRSVVPLAAPHERAGLMAAFYIESYLANSVPAILAGYMVRRLDLLAVANLYGGALIVLVVIGLILTLTRHGRAAAAKVCTCPA